MQASVSGPGTARGRHPAGASLADGSLGCCGNLAQRLAPAKLIVVSQAEVPGALWDGRMFTFDGVDAS
jgi:hypothetical protein